MQKITDKQWAIAIATRVSNEWSGRTEFPEDAELLKDVLVKCLTSRFPEAEKLIGTGIIEDDYFEELS